MCFGGMYGYNNRTGCVRSCYWCGQCHNCFCIQEILGQHIQDDVLKYLNHGWDMMIAFPPCTHLSGAGCHLWPEKQRDGRQQNSNIDKICVENPVGWMNTHWQKPSQIIQPHYFGHPFKKRTCLWLKNLPLLQPTNMVTPTGYWVNSSSNYRKTAKLSNKGLHRDPKERSRTFMGIAEAMAKQWG